MTKQHDLPGLMIVLSSPSGAGKSSIARALMKDNPQMSFSVSATTRDPRPGEVDGREYYFHSPESFDALVRDGQMLEHAVVFGNSYGSPRRPVKEALDAGRDVIFDIDWQGGQQIGESDLSSNLVSIFILPPSIAALEHRLKARAQDSDETVARRMGKAWDEISHWREYDYVLVNEDLDACTQNVRTILAAEKLRRTRQIGLNDFVLGLRQEFDARDA